MTDLSKANDALMARRSIRDAEKRAAEHGRWLSQTKMGNGFAPPDERGDCFAACIASILGWPLAVIPNAHGEGWFEVMDDALYARGYVLGVLDPRYSPPRSLWIATVPSLNLPPEPNGRASLHCVVARGREFVHDPSLGEKYDADSFAHWFDSDWDELEGGFAIVQLDPMVNRC